METARKTRRACLRAHAGSMPTGAHLHGAARMRIAATGKTENVVFLVAGPSWRSYARTRRILAGRTATARRGRAEAIGVRLFGLRNPRVGCWRGAWSAGSTIPVWRRRRPGSSIVFVGGFFLGSGGEGETHDDDGPGDHGSRGWQNSEQPPRGEGRDGGLGVDIGRNKGALGA